MNPLDWVTDPYERKARLYPALLLVAPIVAMTVTVLSEQRETLQLLASVLVGCGGAILLSQVARDGGKRIENDLFAGWGGIPSVAIFRHRDTHLDRLTKARYHEILSALVPGAIAPTAAQEQADERAADEAYRAWSNYLRVNTRDTKKYPLLFDENVNYGYRRNVLGLRPVGILISLVSCIVSVVRMGQLYLATQTVPVEIAAALAVGVVMLVLWVFHFSRDWVRIPAEAYAQRLADAVETFTPSKV